jgi:hypothetical protein
MGLQLLGLLGLLDAVCTLPESRPKARTHFGHNFDTRSGARGVRLSVCLNAEVAVDTVDHNFHPYLHHP